VRTLAVTVAPLPGKVVFLILRRSFAEGITGAIDDVRREREFRFGFASLR
jgi:hypothetical protein